MYKTSYSGRIITPNFFFCCRISVGDFLFEVMSEEDRKIIMAERFKEVETYGSEKESQTTNRRKISVSPEEHEPAYGSKKNRIK